MSNKVPHVLTVS